jgi:GNAT superfamily N-acetyltransferase
MEHEWQRGPYTISTDRERLDFARIHAFLTTSYWSLGITRDAVERAARHSLPFGVYYRAGGELEQQVGYARVLTDYVALAYVSDVFVIETYRGRGLARWLMEVMLAHPDFREVANWQLKTRDAHYLYAKVGFAPPPDPECFMRRTRSADPGPRQLPPGSGVK